MLRLHDGVFTCEANKFDFQLESQVLTAYRNPRCRTNQLGKPTSLVWYRTFPRPQDAIEVEKTIKGWLRKKKLMLIKKENPEWKDLGPEIMKEDC